MHPGAFSNSAVAAAAAAATSFKVSHSSHIVARQHCLSYNLKLNKTVQKKNKEKNIETVEHFRILQHISAILFSHLPKTPTHYTLDVVKSDKDNTTNSLLKYNFLPTKRYISQNEFYGFDCFKIQVNHTLSDITKF